MSRLVPISGADNNEQVGDIIFIHGLGGDCRTTWESPETGAFWPQWLGADLPDVAVWSLDYDAAPSAWMGHAMPLVYRATNVLSLFQGRGIGSRPLVFIAHSLGGLVVKQLLRQSKEYQNPKWVPLTVNTRGVVFLATPHSGSEKANWVDYFRLLTRPNAPIEDLIAHAPQLRDLNTWYCNNAPLMGIATQAYFETRKTRANLFVVDPDSGNPGMAGVFPVGIDSDHFGICKFARRDDQPYPEILGFIRDCLTGPPAPSPPGLHEPSLSIALIEPPKLPIAVPRARDLDEDVEQACIAEAARLGLPDRAWSQEILRPRGEQYSKETQDLHPDDFLGRSLAKIQVASGLNDVERYALKVRDWYSMASSESSHDHRAQTSRARTALFTLAVLNKGTAPAENVTIYISFPIGLSLKTSPSSEENYGFPPPPPIPASLEQEMATKFTKTDAKRQPWYVQSAKFPFAFSINNFYLIKDEDSAEEGQNFNGWKDRIEHGSRVVINSIGVDLQYKPASQLEIRYRLHASNQPHDSAGKILIGFTEIT